MPATAGGYWRNFEAGGENRAGKRRKEGVTGPEGGIQKEGVDPGCTGVRQDLNPSPILFPLLVSILHQLVQTQRDPYIPLP